MIAQNIAWEQFSIQVEQRKFVLLNGLLLSVANAISFMVNGIIARWTLWRFYWRRILGLSIGVLNFMRAIMTNETSYYNGASP